MLSDSYGVISVLSTPKWTNTLVYVYVAVDTYAYAYAYICILLIHIHVFYACICRPLLLPSCSTQRPALSKLHNGRYIIAVCSGSPKAKHYDYKALMLQSVFAAAPAGNGLHSYRLAEVMLEPS